MKNEVTTAFSSSSFCSCNLRNIPSFFPRSIADLNHEGALNGPIPTNGLPPLPLPSDSSHPFGQIQNSTPTPDRTLSNYSSDELIYRRAAIDLNEGLAMFDSNCTNRRSSVVMPNAQYGYWNASRVALTDFNQISANQIAAKVMIEAHRTHGESSGAPAHRILTSVILNTAPSSDGSGLVTVQGCGTTPPPAQAALPSDYCYAQYASRWTSVGCLHDYYVKGMTKSTDGNWDGNGAICCKSTPGVDEQLSSLPSTHLIFNGTGGGGRNSSRRIVFQSVGRSYSSIVSECLAHPSTYASSIVTCPMPDSL